MGCSSPACTGLYCAYIVCGLVCEQYWTVFTCPACWLYTSLLCTPLLRMCVCMFLCMYKMGGGGMSRMPASAKRQLLILCQQEASRDLFYITGICSFLLIDYSRFFFCSHLRFAALESCLLYIVNHSQGHFTNNAALQRQHVHISHF